MANFMRKVKKNQSKQQNHMNSMIKNMKRIHGMNDSGKYAENDLSKMIETQFYGSVDNPHFPNIKNKERVRDLKLDEEGLLKKFTNEYFKDSFTTVQRYVELNSYIRKMTYTKNALVDIDMLEICINEKDLKDFFALQYDYCVDRINYLVDIAEYSKNKGYKALYDRFEKNFKKYIDTSNMELMILSENPIHVLRSI